MKIKNILEKVLLDDKFAQWKENNKSCYVAHIFKMFDKPNENMWQIGFFCPDIGKIVPIEYENENIRVGEPADVFREDGSDVAKLDVESVKLDIDDILGKMKSLQEEKYSAHMPMKIIVILQTLEDKPVYNVTYVASSFKVLNVKFDAVSGEIVHENLTAIFDFKK